MEREGSRSGFFGGERERERVEVRLESEEGDIRISEVKGENRGEMGLRSFKFFRGLKMGPRWTCQSPLIKLDL